MVQIELRGVGRSAYDWHCFSLVFCTTGLWRSLGVVGVAVVRSFTDCAMSALLFLSDLLVWGILNLRTFEVSLMSLRELLSWLERKWRARELGAQAEKD
jgi:hypothetical protein